MKHTYAVSRLQPIVAQEDGASDLIDKAVVSTQYVITKSQALSTFVQTGLQEGFFESDDLTILGL